MSNMIKFTFLATLVAAALCAPSHRFLELESDHPSNRKFEIEEGSQWRHASVQDPWIKFFTQRALEKIEGEENDGIRLLNVQLIDSIVEPTDNGLHYKLRFVVGKTNCLTSDLICDYLNVVTRKVYEAEIHYDYATRQDDVSVWSEGDEIF